MEWGLIIAGIIIAILFFCKRQNCSAGNGICH